MSVHPRNLINPEYIRQDTDKKYPEIQNILVHTGQHYDKNLSKIFFDELNITTVDELFRAAEKGKLSVLPGIKEKTAENIISGINIVKQGQGNVK